VRTACAPWRVRRLLPRACTALSELESLRLKLQFKFAALTALPVPSITAITSASCIASVAISLGRTAAVRRAIPGGSACLL
jgi:hypothetical protein